MDILKRHRHHPCVNNITKNSAPYLMNQFCFYFIMGGVWIIVHVLEYFIIELNNMVLGESDNSQMNIRNYIVTMDHNSDQILCKNLGWFHGSKIMTRNYK